MSTWARDAVFYHIYPLGLCGAPHRNDFAAPPEPRLAQIIGWIDHLRRLGVTALYLGPVFESTTHGYDTADYYRVDRRLGSNATLAALVAALHAAGIRVLLDGVFHHVGRDFWAFRDLQAHREHSAYRDWFAGVDFRRTSPCGDPFAYEDWNGHFELVKLNVHHPAVRAHLFGAMRQWIAEYRIDGLRLDVADSLDSGFLRDLAAFCRREQQDFWLLGEVLHGDYRRWANPDTLDSVTNYECYKSLYSSHNDRNYFEIAYALERQFGEQGIYRDLPLYAFADNHDVSRVASALRDPAHLYPLHALLFTMPGVPAIYYGSEWGVSGIKRRDDDWPLRPHLTWPDAERRAPHPDLAAAIARFARVRHEIVALRRGTYRQCVVAREQLAFERRHGDEYVVVAVNAAATPARLDFHAPIADGREFVDLLDPQYRCAVRKSRLCIDPVPPCWARILLMR